MMSAQFFLGAAVFTLLAVDVCCIPVKGLNYHDSYGSGYANAALSPGSHSGGPSGHYASGGPSGHYASGVVPYDSSYQPAPESSFAQPAVYREPAAPVGSGSSSRPVGSGHSGSAVRMSAVGSAPAAPSQPGPRDTDWVVAPPSVFSGGEGMAAGAPHVGSSSIANVSPPLPPPGPMFQAGELNHFEQSYEDGDYQRETEEQGFMPPPRPYMSVGPSSAGPSFTSPPRPGPGHGHWGFYPYYDYRFLTGQYPPGTVSRASSSFEQGVDHWQDAHYVKENIPYPSAPVQAETFASYPAAPQSFSAPQLPVKQPVKAGY